MTHSRNKGKRGELEFAKLLRDNGYEGAYRGQQFKGGQDSPDVVCPGLEDIHFEVKRVEAGNPYLWLGQAIKDGVGKTPVVAHRKNDKEWIAIMRMEDLLNLLCLKGTPDA